MEGKMSKPKKYPGLKYILHIKNVKPGQNLAKISHELLTKAIVSIWFNYLLVKRLPSAFPLNQYSCAGISAL